MAAGDGIHDAVEDFGDRCRKIAERPAAERLRAEAEAFEELVDGLAAVYAAEPDANPTVDQVAYTVAEVSETLTKTAITDEITTAARQLRAADDENGVARWALDEWVAEHLVECRITRTTDHVDSTRYTWDFGAVTVETSGGEEARGHYSWLNFRDTVYEAGGPYCDDPADPLTDPAEWRDWIVRQLEAVKTEKTNVGPRTSAVHWLEDRVRQADAFETVEDAITFQGVQVDVIDEPPEDAEPVDTDGAPQELPEWRVGQIRLPNEWAVDAADELGISTRALQNEIDARGYMLPGHSKIATREYAAGEYHTMWKTIGDFATPAAYHPADEIEDYGGATALESAEQATEDDFGAIGE